MYCRNAVDRVTRHDTDMLRRGWEACRGAYLLTSIRGDDGALNSTQLNYSIWDLER